MVPYCLAVPEKCLLESSLRDRGNDKVLSVEAEHIFLSICFTYMKGRAPKSIQILVAVTYPSLLRYGNTPLELR